ncbi:uncharacterized protein C8Q71DRAFT_775057 [Rhodofomes roseus]|uniref:Uncharacterized protein n=1 Tax=Rhodofomes roseus TaxID=34475 RepID=A0ABQ8K8R2_9APHY|nr:uncharacterized protein C8Q71DRAFT_775057 [Rhodofomes roseus]KAH9833324.1 hypothetical protein C8Q71DRAFT_775057 [Rhodofomes roseus]
MEPLHLHAPRATSEPLNLKRALMEWRQNLADESHSLDDTMQAPEATTSYSAAPQFQTAPPADTRSHLDEWTEAMVIVQIKLIRSKLAYFRMLLDQATLDTEQRTALQEFASELRATMEALEAKSLTGGDIASAQGVWPGSPSEEDITEMSFDSSSAGGSSSDVSLSLPPDFDVEALLSGGATRLDGSYVPSSYESSLSSQLEDALRNPATAPMFDVGASYPPQQPLQAQVGSTSYSYTLSQVQVSVSSSVYNVRSDSDSSSYAPQAIPWYMDYSQWTNVPHDDSSSECNTAATFSSASPWDTEFHMPGDFNDYNQHQQDFNSTVASNGSLPLYDVQSTASSMSFASDGATAAQFPHVDSTAQVPGWYQAREFQYAMGDGRLLAVHGMDPSSPHSWSSNMSECSIVL